jgi:hypothetical protein
MSMRASRLALILALLMPSPGLGDIVPPRPAPAPPAGPDKAVIRGVELSRANGYWQGRRWLTSIKACAPTQPACAKLRVGAGPSCLVVGIDGRTIEGGDIAALVAADKAAAGRPIRLRLEDCGDLKELELKP